MADLLLPDFPDSMLERIDRCIELLGRLNSGQTWSRTQCVSTLLGRALAQIEGAQIQSSRRKVQGTRIPERRRGDADRRRTRERRRVHYPEMVDLVIDRVLHERSGDSVRIQEETWKDREDSES